MSQYWDIRKAIQELSIEEAQQALIYIMHQFDLAENNDAAKADLYENLKDLSRELLISKNPADLWEPDDVTKVVHIVFGDSPAGSLKLAMKQLGYVDTNKVVSFYDGYFSTGPLWQLHEEAGRIHRNEWFRDHINDNRDEYEHDYEVYHQGLMSLLATIPPEAQIIIWSGNNAHEQVGLRYAVYLLRHHLNEIYVFDAGVACEKRFNTVDRFIEYLHMGEIPPEKLQAVFDEAMEGGPITCEARQRLELEWLALAEQHDVLRIWNGEEIQSVDEHYFDSYLLGTIEKLHEYRSNHDFIKAARVIGEAIGYGQEYIGDSYYEYRLRCLIYSGELEIKGVPRAMRYYSVRRK